MLASMGLLFDSFWRAAAYCARPRVIAMSLLPLLLTGVLALGLRHFYWRTAVLGMQTLLESSPLLTNIWHWLEGWGLSDVTSVIAPLMVVLSVTPVLVMVSLFTVAVLMTPALVSLVAARRFPHLDRKNGGSFLASVVWQVSSTVLALIALVVSMPLWLVPPLVLVLPPLIWGWLTFRVMAFDALAEHASKQERQELFRRHRSSLLGIGILTGYLGAAPALVWASGVIFAAAFFVLIPLAIWIYTLVFAFSSLWFAHFSLDALQGLRAETLAELPSSTQLVSTEDASAAPSSLAPSGSTSPLLVSPNESATNGPPIP
ncbi:MAG: EI24 domain-containing protein [Burkholderiaceae bacterium]|nr:EI24 domain-containing protein [Burkholderiaceae bacterium]